MIAIDPETETKLREVLGMDLEQAAKEALIAEAYRKSKLSIGQAARLLHLSVNDAHGFMKERGIAVNYTLADFDSDCQGLRDLRAVSK